MGEEVEKLARDYNELREIHDRKAAHVEALRKALEPFAACAKHDIGETEDDADTFRNSTHNRAPKITVGDLRRALSAISTQAEESGDKPTRSPLVELADRVRACVTASGGIDLRDPNFLHAVADALCDASGLIFLYENGLASDTSVVLVGRALDATLSEDGKIHQGAKT